MKSAQHLRVGLQHHFHAHPRQPATRQDLGRQQGGPLLTVVALLAGAAVLLQSLPHAESGLQVLPVAPWCYGGWLLVGISLLLWMAIIFAAYVAISGCLDAPKVFSAVVLISMSLNGLLGFVAPVVG